MRAIRFVSAIVLGLALAAPAAFASVDSRVLMLDDIRTQQTEIRDGVEARTGRYKDLSTSQRNELLNKQARMLQTIEGKHSTEELNAQQKTEVFNTLEWIEAVVNNDDDERLVCERRPVLGSTRKERVCKTATQWREEREAARNMMDSRGACMDCKSN
ncbi:hypothetical protein [Lysobacter auxotrophicus]|uniref:Uncharacterized protein n=1 Tax=Lysobacter auxotrophicus TaxID=2992573 RepID=A0ABM8DID1_9GAMM|nr:hypothetical protein [Lysobacter auxotrophicus]BDU18402.1 hypothetical protein LA521A_36030 [Lysobacter auxotrophicus]